MNDKHTCENCGIEENVEWTICPYASDVHDIIQYHWLCSQCCDERAADI
jgi:hypothetical protein